MSIKTILLLLILVMQLATLFLGGAIYFELGLGDCEDFAEAPTLSQEIEI